MISAKTVFKKAKEIHYQGQGEKRMVAISQIAKELEITPEEVGTHLTSLKNLRMIKFDEQNTDSITVTKVGLSTLMG